MLFQPTRTRLIPLSRGLWTLVDADDFPSLNARRWYAQLINGGFYAARNSYSSTGVHRPFYMHRAITGAPVGIQVDHRNMDGLDNRRSNLRLATKSQNMQNMGPQANNTSGYKGVSFDPSRGKWAANVTLNRRTYRLGRFDSPEEAARVYDAKARELHGEFAHVNFP